LNTSAIAVSPSTAQPDSQFVVDRAELLPDEHLAMTPSSDMPMREGWREGSGGCLMCGRPRPSTRARYCTRACQQRSYRLRHQSPIADLTTVRRALQRGNVLVAHTIYECGRCGERFLGERRCGDCNLFTRALGLGGACPECDTPVLIEDLLGEGVLPTT
jgi:hypothetical protein